VLTVKFLVGQLADALNHIHEKGVVHRDMKPENILITPQCKAVLIDFGLAAWDGKSCPLDLDSQTNYFAPELHHHPCAPSADLWGIGYTLYRAYVQDTLDDPEGIFNTAYIFTNGIEAYLPDDMNPAMDREIRTALVKLLDGNPENRWSLEDVNDWAKPAEIAQEWILPINIMCRRWVERAGQEIYPLFRVQIPDGWEHAGKTLSTIKLNMTVAFIDQRAHWYKRWDKQSRRFYYKNGKTSETQDDPPPSYQIVDLPKADTQLREGDWVFVGCSDKVASSEEEVRKRLENTFLKPARNWQSRNAASTTQSILRVVPEFDQFRFPDHFHNSVLGDLPGEGQNALDCRNKFHINVAGISRDDGSTLFWWPGPSHRIEKGDVCLVARKFDAFCGTSSPTVNGEVIDNLMVEAKFREVRGLDDDSTWAAWCRNAEFQCSSAASTASITGIVHG